MECVPACRHLHDPGLLTVAKAVIVQVVDVGHVDGVLKHTCGGWREESGVTESKKAV